MISKRLVRSVRTSTFHALGFREDVTGLKDEATAIGLQERSRVDHHMIGMDHASRKKLPLDLEWHYTPEHGSWLNVAGCELSVLEWQCLARWLPEVETLTREVAAWEHGRNQAYVTIAWRLTTADARIK